MTSEALGIRHGEGNPVDLMLSPPGLLNGTHHPHPPHTPLSVHSIGIVRGEEGGRRRKEGGLETGADPPKLHSRPLRRCFPGQSTSGCTTRMCRVSASLREKVFSSVHR